MIPSRIVRYRLPRDAANSILFTFDDGPCPDCTKRVLDTLDAHGAKAVFFMPGEAAGRHPLLVEEVCARGHEIGNHSFSHPTTILDFKSWVKEMQRCQDLLFDITARKPRYFRPVQGRVTPAVLRAARHCGLEVMHWTLDSGDYSYLKHASAEQLADNLMQRIAARSIILAHDDHAIVIPWLELVLPRLKDRGYRFDQLL